VQIYQEVPDTGPGPGLLRISRHNNIGKAFAPDHTAR
jgi:hypothetical protein